MHGPVLNLWTRRWGYVCVKPRTRAFGLWWPAYFYLSPNATPWAATLLLGREYGRSEKMMARVRWALWGHGYDVEEIESDPQRVAAYVAPIAGSIPGGGMGFYDEALEQLEIARAHASF